MILFYPVMAAVWLLLAAFLFLNPLDPKVPMGPLFPYGALGLGCYDLLRFTLRLWMGRTRKIEHDEPYPDKPVIAPEFDFENRERRDP